MYVKIMTEDTWEELKEDCSFRDKHWCKGQILGASQLIATVSFEYDKCLYDTCPFVLFSREVVNL